MSTLTSPIAIEKQFPKAYKYLDYLVKKHKINIPEMVERAYRVEKIASQLKKIPTSEYGEIQIPIISGNGRKMGELIKII